MLQPVPPVHDEISADPVYRELIGQATHQQIQFQKIDAGAQGVGDGGEQKDLVEPPAVERGVENVVYELAG